MKNLISVVGIRKSGKDTVADYLVKNYGYTKYGFADPLKKGVQEMFDFSDEQMWGTQEQKETVDERWGISPRRVLQLVGTELLQFDIHKYTVEGELPMGRAIWVHRFKIWYKKELLKNPDIKIVFCDNRFPHEATEVRNLGGEVWKINRPEVDIDSTHDSEVSVKLIDGDRTIENTGTLDELYSIVENYLEFEYNNVVL